MLYGLLDLSFWGYVVAILITTHITIAAVTIFFHRAQAHRALDLHPIVSHFFRFWLWMTTGMITKVWVAIHRKHHVKCETEEDPHSPQILGIKKVLLEGAELYRQEAKNQETLDKYGNGTPDDWIERNVYTKRSRTGIYSLLGIYVILFGLPGVTLWAIQMAWIPIWAAGVVNGIGHFRGYRNYETNDAATNVSPWGIIIGGEELHNNHHAFPNSAKLSSKPWEFDIGWMYICIMEKVGLAKVNKVATEPMLNPGKSDIDMDTVRAVISHRMHVFAQYASEVTLKVHREELNRADESNRSLLKKAKVWLVREESLMDDKEKSSLEKVLDKNAALNTVYEYRQSLQELWQRSANNQEQLLKSLQEWCKQAEATGNQYLQNFAQILRSYDLKSA